MKIKEIRTRVVRWRGQTVALPPHFCRRYQTLPCVTFTSPKPLVQKVYAPRQTGR